MEIVLGQFDDADFDNKIAPVVTSTLHNGDGNTLSSDFKRLRLDEVYEDGFIEDKVDILEDELMYKDTGSHYQPLGKVLSRFESKIKVDVYEHSFSEKSTKTKDKSDRATAEQVMDPRTRLILFKLLSRGTICEINGVLSTGKEANVYHAATPNGSQRAIKIYKTSILIFKDRDRYVSGEFRFRHGFCKGNPRKMVATWAEKEMRNLTRLSNAGIKCPTPYLLKGHVLIMEFIGHNDIPAPLLKNVSLSENKYRELYLECIHMIRNTYHKAKLIHADLSEYNILYNNGGLVFIDVSQSVEHDHQNALVFLRKDCQNINEFFRKKGVPSMNLKELFDFVTDVTINDDNIDDYLEAAMKIASERTYNQSGDDNGNIDANEDEIFKNSFIPRTLGQVKHYERDIEKAKKGEATDLLYQKVTGINVDLSGAKDEAMLLDGNESNDESVHDDVVATEAKPQKNVTLSRKTMTKEEKKNHKKLVKEENRIKRLDKIPKHVKKRKEKLPQAKRKK